MKRVWLISGCSSGFGRELAYKALRTGDNVVVTARKINDIADIVAEYPHTALACQLDVTKPHDIESCVEAAIQRFGRIDVLVNNAGIGYFSSIEEGTEEEIRKLFDINFFGLNRLTQQVLPVMRRQNSGFIVNFSSMGGLMAFPGVGYYNATKFAVEGYSEALFKELRPLGIKVLLVEPGPFRTNWAGRSAKENTDSLGIYQGSDTFKSNLKTDSGREAGDPVRAAEAIITILNAPNPPLRLLLGETALNVAYEKIALLRSDFDNWKALTLSADFPKTDLHLFQKH